MLTQSRPAKALLFCLSTITCLVLAESQVHADHFQPTASVAKKSGYVRVTVRLDAKIGPLQINQSLGSFNVPNGQTVNKSVNTVIGLVKLEFKDTWENISPDDLTNPVRNMRVRVQAFTAFGTKVKSVVTTIE